MIKVGVWQLLLQGSVLGQFSFSPLSDGTDMYRKAGGPKGLPAAVCYLKKVNCWMAQA